jgi:hypothetical protein
MSHFLSWGNFSIVRCSSSCYLGTGNVVAQTNMLSELLVPRHPIGYRSIGRHRGPVRLVSCAGLCSEPMPACPHPCLLFARLRGRSCLLPLSTRIPCATPYLLLKHSNTTLKWNTWNHCKHMQLSDKTLATYLWNACNIQISILTTYIEKIDATLEIDACNIIQPLHHIQHSGLLLQHPYETLITYLNDI